MRSNAEGDARGIDGSVRQWRGEHARREQRCQSVYPTSSRVFSRECPRQQNPTLGSSHALVENCAKRVLALAERGGARAAIGLVGLCDRLVLAASAGAVGQQPERAQAPPLG